MDRITSFPWEFVFIGKMLGTLSHWKHSITERNPPPLQNSKISLFVICLRNQSWIGVFGWFRPCNCKKITKHSAFGLVMDLASCLVIFSVTWSELTKLNNEWFVPILTQQEIPYFNKIPSQIHQNKLRKNCHFLEKNWVPVQESPLQSIGNPVFHSGGEFLSVTEWFSVRQGTQHFTDENKVSRKWSDSVHLLPFQLNKNNTTTHQVLIVKIQNQKLIKLSYNIYYKTHSQIYMRPTINQ